MTTVTGPLREEHAALFGDVLALGDAARALTTWDVATAARVRSVVDRLTEQLEPHAAAEEAVLYPWVERVLGSPAATATMSADHAEIRRRLAALGRSVHGPVATGSTERIRAALYGLEAIVSLHFRKEDEVLLSAIDAHLTPQEAEVMLDELAAVAHGDASESVPVGAG